MEGVELKLEQGEVDVHLAHIRRSGGHVPNVLCAVRFTIIGANAGGIIWTRTTASQLFSRGWRSTGRRRHSQQAVADRPGLSWDEIQGLQQARKRGLERGKADTVMLGVD